MADATGGGDPIGARFERLEADRADELSDEILTLPTTPKIGIGGELVLADDKAELPSFVDQRPDRVTAEASRDRLDLAANAGTLTLSVDAADTIRPRNSLEKMLAHQMPAAHAACMRMRARAETEMEGAKFPNATAATRRSRRLLWYNWFDGTARR